LLATPNAPVSCCYTELCLFHFRRIWAAISVHCLSPRAFSYPQIATGDPEFLQRDALSTKDPDVAGASIVITSVQKAIFRRDPTNWV
jgi:hypothetical protein